MKNLDKNNLIYKFLIKEQIEEDKAYKAEKKLLTYMGKILLYNKNVNITGIVEPEEFIKKHIIDSLLIISEEEFSESNLILDLGTGGGFPGIPLALLYPEKTFLLLDSIKKKLNIIDEICGYIDIKNVHTVHSRAEDLGQDADYREKFDLVVSRAVAELSVLSELALPFVKLGGDFAAYKGPGIRKEVERGEIAIETLGGRISKIVESNCYEQNHRILFVSKVKKTPGRFPRKAGIPIKKPLVE